MNDNAVKLGIWLIVIAVFGLAFGWAWALIPTGVLIIGTIVANI